MVRLLVHVRRYPSARTCWARTPLSSCAWMLAALLRQFQEEIARLQSMLESGEGGAAGGGGDGSGAAHGGIDLEQLQRMKAETEKAETEKAQMMELLEKERAEREAIDAQLAALKAKLVGGVGIGDDSAALLEGPVSPAKDEATLATPGKPAAQPQVRSLIDKLQLLSPPSLSVTPGRGRRTTGGECRYDPIAISTANGSARGSGS
jgi:hypothetical protein